uniref:Uncharacterized protein n=1 Tax=Mycena chlorophos TaxID=658473 RepID=A0ABQ0LMF0_MYCCL|nr:predicted protein [Mycena chlorophos]
MDAKTVAVAAWAHQQPHQPLAAPRSTSHVLLTLVRDLVVTMLLSCLITIGLLHCIWLYLTVFFPIAIDGSTSVEQMGLKHFVLPIPLPLDTVNLPSLQRALGALTYTDVLRVTAVFTLVVFAFVEAAAFFRTILCTRPAVNNDLERGAQTGFVETEKRV